MYFFTILLAAVALQVSAMPLPDSIVSTIPTSCEPSGPCQVNNAATGSSSTPQFTGNAVAEVVNLPADENEFVPESRKTRRRMSARNSKRVLQLASRAKISSLIDINDPNFEKTFKRTTTT